MKNIRYISVFLTLLLAAGCSNDNIGELAVSNGDDDKELHFIQTSLVKEFEQGTAVGEMTVTVARNGNKGTYSVLISKGGANSDLFDVADMVVIPDGSYSVDIPVSVNMAGVVLGSTVSASLYIIGRDAYLGDSSAYITQYSDNLDLSASFKLEWEPYMVTDKEGNEVQQTATFHYDVFYTGYQTGMEVERAVGTTNIFRVLDWGAGVPLLFKLNSDNSCVVPAQSIGYFYSETNEYVYVSDIPTYLGDDSYYGSYPCTYDGNGNFSFTLVYYVTDGMFGYGKETLMLDGYEPEPSVAMSYEIAGDTDVKISCTANETAAWYLVTVVSGDISSDKEALEKAKTALVAGEKPGDFEVLRFAEDNVYQCSPVSHVCTALALAFDSEGNPGELSALRFTFDPSGEFLPQIETCTFEPYVNNPYSTLIWTLKTKNTVSVKYAVMIKEVYDYYMEVYTEEQLIANGYDLGTNMETVNTEGAQFPFTEMEEGCTYQLIVAAYNSFGDMTMASVSARTASHADNMDQTRNIDDFTGAFLANATVTNSLQTSSTESFRVDIIKTGENTLRITGLCNDISYSPSVTGTYIPERHTVSIASQNVGTYSDYVVRFGFVSYLYTAVWGGGELEFGYGDDGYIHWRKTPGSLYDFTGYKFLLFETDGTYAQYSVGDKSYESVKMTRLTKSSFAGTELKSPSFSYRKMSDGKFAKFFRAGE